MSKSFGLLRTNVGLTTNVKVVVDSQYGLSLDSIDSATELSSTKYKKMSFSKENYYDDLIPKFWGNLPADLAYYIKYEDDSNSMTDNFASQYDEIYQYGARNITNNKSYSEEFEYFAPLYIAKNRLPKNFIVFRVDGSGMMALNRFNIRNEVFRKFKTVKLFDLSEQTVLGEWLNKNINKNEFFPESSLNISFTRLEFSNWIGIDYTTGGYISRSLFLDDVIEEEKEIFEMEKFVFDGYKKNKVVFPNIINFSFLFDDTPATPDSLRKWSINRYYGFYLDGMDRIATISPYRTPFLKQGVAVKPGNILYLESGDPFEEGWNDGIPFYVEYLGEYYKVETFTETLKKSVKPVRSPKGATSQVAAAQLEDIGTSLKTNAVSDKVTETVTRNWRIISDIDLSGKESMLNSNIGYIDSDGFLVNYDQTFIEIDGLDLADVWLIEIDGLYHNLIKDGTKIKLNTDYSFKFSENSYEYWINRTDPSYSKSVSFVVDQNNPPKKFSIYRMEFTDIKDFDDRIVDTEYSKFEYEKIDELTETEEPKLYLTNLNSKSYPKALDDFRFNDKVVNIPVSSEYTANNETFKVSGSELSQIWRKNPVYCRWAYEGSLSANDYPYPLNNSLVLGEYNLTTNTGYPYPFRKERNLDYFYTVNSSTFSYLHHTLHVEKNGPVGIDTKFEFDFEKYIGTDTFTDGISSNTYSIDYFSYFFDRKTSFLSNDIRKNVKKYSLFTAGDSNTPNSSLFRGIKFSVYDVENIKKNAAGQIDKINLNTSNAFDDYKLSILLTKKDNGMVWQVIEKWEMGRKYEKDSIVSHDDILYRAIASTETNAPVFNYKKFDANRPNSLIYSSIVKSTPYTQLKDVHSDWKITDTNYNTISKDWELYEDEKSIFWNPKKTYSIDEVVYNHGDYYIRINPIGRSIDFWNALNVYSANTYLYNKNSIVLFAGDFYISTIDRNIQPPDNSSFWKKFSAKESESKWNRIRIWNPGTGYAKNSYVVHNHIVYGSGESSKLAGEEPGKINSSWSRIYGVEQDTDFIYQPDSNPIINMNDKVYLIKSNPNNSTLENGINIYINKKWKNILINISINDNTVENMSNSDRDLLYTSSNKKLTAKNFIDAINDLSNKYEFTDYINYYVIEDGKYKRYSYASGIEGLPYILYAERPENFDVKVNSLDITPVNITKLNATKSLKNGAITDISYLNYFNETHIASEIEYNNETPLVLSNYNGITNITSKTLRRFGGGYMPLFRDINIFKKDNAVSYNEIDIILDVSKRQTVYFKYERDGKSFERDYYINPGLSYSSASDPLSGYYQQLIDIINNESLLSDISFMFEIRKNENFRANREHMLLHLDADLYNGTSIWGDLGKNSNNVKLNNVRHTKTNIYPGSYFTNNSNIIRCSKKISFGKNTTWEAWVRCNSYSTSQKFFMCKAGDSYFGFYGNSGFNGIVFKNRINNAISIIYGTAILTQKTWYHIAFTTSYDGAKTTSKIYIDGVENISSIFTGEQTSAESEFLIGKSDGANTDFAGDISAIRIHNRTLSAEEIMKSFVDRHSLLNIKYKSTFGELKIKLDRIYPSLILNIIDLGGELTRTFQMGATGGTAPYQWSFNGGAFSSTDTYTISNSITSHTVLVKDYIGLTSSSGYYTVNNFENKTSVNGVFLY